MLWRVLFLIKSKASCYNYYRIFSNVWNNVSLMNRFLRSQKTVADVVYCARHHVGAKRSHLLKLRDTKVNEQVFYHLEVQKPIHLLLLKNCPIKFQYPVLNDPRFAFEQPVRIISCVYDNDWIVFFLRLTSSILLTTSCMVCLGLGWFQLVGGDGAYDAGGGSLLPANFGPPPPPSAGKSWSFEIPDEKGWGLAPRDGNS